jgi:hypothetical protein
MRIIVHLKNSSIIEINSNGDVPDRLLDTVKMAMYNREIISFTTDKNVTVIRGDEISGIEIKDISIPQNIQTPEIIHIPKTKPKKAENIVDIPDLIGDDEEVTDNEESDEIVDDVVATEIYSDESDDEDDEVLNEVDSWHKGLEDDKSS